MKGNLMPPSLNMRTSSSRPGSSRDTSSQPKPLNNSGDQCHSDRCCICQHAAGLRVATDRSAGADFQGTGSFHRFFYRGRMLLPQFKL
jgi:hypothetical protein